MGNKVLDHFWKRHGQHFAELLLIYISDSGEPPFFRDKTSLDWGDTLAFYSMVSYLKGVLCVGGDASVLWSRVQITWEDYFTQWQTQEGDTSLDSVSLTCSYVSERIEVAQLSFSSLVPELGSGVPEPQYMRHEAIA